MPEVDRHTKEWYEEEEENRTSKSHAIRCLEHDNDLLPFHLPVLGDEIRFGPIQSDTSTGLQNECAEFAREKVPCAPKVNTGESF
jgi:hypothetical protein